MMWIWMVSTVSFAACPDDPVAVASDQSALVLDAYDRADGSALVEVAVKLDFAIGCLDEPLPPRVAVEVHRAKALIAYYDGEDAAVVSSWAAVRHLDPLVRPDDARWPPSHSMWSFFDEAATASDERVSVRVPPGGWVVDGEPRPDVPRSRAFLLQGLDRDGGVIYSGYLYSLAEIPDTDWAELDPTARQRRRGRIRTIGTVVASTLGAGAVGSMAVAATSRSAIDKVAYEEIDASALTANTSASLAVGLASGALTTAVLTWSIRW